MTIKETIKNYQEDMLQDLAGLIKYNSVLETTHPEYPFGETNAKCLSAALELFERHGFKTKNLDYYSGFGEIGSGEPLIGILGHLDVVPAGEGWSSDPFTLTRKGDTLVGRGVADDKGPVIAALYAMKIIKEMHPVLNKRLRLIVGCNEESGSKCLDYYVKKEGHIDYGFTPDGSFPGVHGEKGFVSGTVSATSSAILAIEGGVASNVVLTHVKAELVQGGFDVALLEKFLEENGLKFSYEADEIIKLDVEGVSAHASTPELGKNALSYLMVGLKKAGLQDPYVEFYTQLIGLSYDGSASGLDCSDDYGALSLNIGRVYQVEDRISVTVDIRYPVTLHHDPIIAKMRQVFESAGGFFDKLSGSNSLFYEPNSPMIQALVQAYQTVTHDLDSKPEVIGGGTYSKGINNCIAFGGGFNNYDYHMHDKDENMTIDQLLLQTEIYVEAILNLLAL